MRDPRETYANYYCRSWSSRQPRRALLRHLFAPAEGADHLRLGSDRRHIATLVIAQLLFLEAENPKKEISMYINSPGGVVTAGLAIYDTMQYIRPRVGDALHRSGGVGGLPAPLRWGKGQRFALPNSRVMLHQPSGGAQGQATDIARHAQEIVKLKRRLNEIYVEAHGPTR